MMKKYLMKFLALALMACAWMQPAQAADLLVGGELWPGSTYLNEGSDIIFWIGKCHLNPGEDPREKYKNAEPIEVEYEICSLWDPDEEVYGHGFSSNGFVRVKSEAVAKITGLEPGDCVYIAEVLSKKFPDVITDFGLDFENWVTDELEDGEDGVLHGGKYWFVENIAGKEGGEIYDGYYTCCVYYDGCDPIWQCRIGDDNYETLEEALEAANAGDTIYLKRDVDLKDSVTINKNVTIATENGGQVAIRRLGDCSIDIAANVTFTNVVVNGLSYAATKPMFDVANGATLTLAADTRVNSCVNTSGNGGAIASSGTVVLDGARLVTSSASGRGGAIYAAGGTVEARGGEISGCSAALGGGAIYLADGATLNLAGAFLATGNTAGDAVNNVEPTGAAQIVVPGAFTGSVGVTYPAVGVSARDGVQFGLVQGGANVANRFQSDVSSATYSAAVESDGRLVWKEKSWDKPVPVVTGLVAPESLAATGAETKIVDGEVVLIFTNTAAVGSFTIPSNTYARILCVAGGAAGGTVGLGATEGAGGGGGAGGFYELTTVLKPGSYEVSVGAGARRVDSYTQSWVGNNGGTSWIRRADDATGNYLMTAKGGGGGGAPKDNGVATEGGSGGGGSWWHSKALAAGTATDGYGWKGAKPTEESLGGGGGGAAVASADGAGKATGEGGAGRASDITGETVVYAAGGNGGQRLNATWVPKDGVTPGSGGDGAGMPGKGGAGADGIVVVRLEKAFTPVKIPHPSFATGVPWVDGSTVSPFGDDLATATNRFFIAGIEGSLEVPCSLDGLKKEGIGRYSFTVTLKDGYVWDDGSVDGTMQPKTFFWRVKDPAIEGQATSEVTKTVSWFDGTNATISIEAHTTPEISTDPPKVLVLGTLCDAHRLTPETVQACLNAAAEVADVEYYFYSTVTEHIPYWFVFEEGKEEVAAQYWDEFWTAFWASRAPAEELWGENAYELWKEWEEKWHDLWNDWKQYAAESRKPFEIGEVGDRWEVYNWENYWRNYDEIGGGERWKQYWEENWKDKCFEEWSAIYWKKVWSEISDYVEDDDDAYWDQYWEDYWKQYNEFDSDEGWEDYWENYWFVKWKGSSFESFAEDWRWGYWKFDLDEIPPLVQGELSKGQKFADLDELAEKFDNPQHHALYGFYGRLAQLIDAGKEYDYIILCFDRSHVADEFPRAHPREADVAEFLKPLYAEGRVIWMVDNETPGVTDAEPIVWATPWRPSQFLCITPTGGVPYWTTYYSCLFDWGPYFYDEDIVAENRQQAWTVHKALFGMFDPEAYETLDEQTFCANVIDSMTSFTPEQVAATSGKANPNQVVYDDAGSVADMVKRVIKPVNYIVKLQDSINVAQDLELDGVSGVWTANAETLGWTPLVEGENLFPTDKGASIEIKGVNSDIWIRLDLKVRDNGGFRTSIGAKYDTRTGLWEKDPNDGPVTVETVDVASGTQTTEEKATSTEWWSFPGFELTGEVMSGPNTGDIVVNGYSTNWVAVGANSSPQTVFRAAPGYILEKLMIDGEEVEFNIETCDWIFKYVNADHDVKVWYKPYLVVDPPPPVTGPVTNLYDGTAYGPTVTNVCFTEDIPYPWYPVYSMDPDAPNDQWSTTNGQTTVIWGEDGTPQPTNVYVRIAVEQPGYEEPVVLDNWTGVNTVTILPREITVQYENFVQTNDVQKTTDFDWHLVESLNVTNQLVKGDSPDETGSTCIAYPVQGEHTTNSITNDSANVVIHNSDGEDVSGNYIVHVLPGDYYYPGNEIIADSEGVRKYYDGEPSTITVKAQVADLPTPEELHETWSSTGNYTYIGNVTTTGIQIRYKDEDGNYTLVNPPEYTDAGTYTVDYQVTYTYSFDHGSDPDHVTTETVTFTTITGSDVVEILKRPVYVAADSAFKYYDGMPLTEGGYTIEPPTATTGFVAGEGATFQMTGDSSQTQPGKTANTIDQNSVTPTDGTNLNNYEIHYTDGTLTVKDRLATVPEGVEKIYNGEPSTIRVEVDLASGTPITSDDYTIKYSLYPDDPDSWVDDLSFVNVGVSNKVYYVVEAEGFDPVTNYAYVTIWPREIVVTADDKRKQRGEEDPELTWVVSDGTNGVGAVVGILPGEEDLVNAAVSNDVWHVIERPSAGTPEGEKPTHLDDPGYPILVDGSDYVGNYHVTYVPGALIIPAIFTSNIHGLLKINSPFANTIIPAPWKGYTRDGSPSLDIPVDRLVKPRNLTDGDMILQYSNGGVYKAWTLEKPDGGEGKWTPMGAVAQTPVVGGSTNVVSSLYVKPTGEETQKRGYGMWLVRQHPVDENNNVIPFYLYGQWMTGVETVTIGGTNATDVAIKYEGAQYDVVHDTMLADPDCTRTSVINNHQWTGFDNADTIILNTDLKQSLYCFRRERPKRSGGGWYDGWWIWGVNGHTTEGISTPAGVGFWYERRAAGDMTLRWEGPDQYTGEGRDLDVWIVDHADGGDGKTHLAFKFVGEYAQDPITPEYIKELFDSHSIRYLHTTGETQAEGKAEMDRLSLNLKDNARVVLALRNGTGVNTQEELAKGWIWVTVDAPDGATEKSDKDGTGDTNGAGDLWRIVVGRGVWDE